jgi:hypothetical protein
LKNLYTSFPYFIDFIVYVDNLLISTLDNESRRFPVEKPENFVNYPDMGTIARRQFMRGTDPIKSTWVYPKLFM